MTDELQIGVRGENILEYPNMVKSVFGNTFLESLNVGDGKTKAFCFGRLSLAMVPKCCMLAG
jgi:hypothetical protein